MNFTCFSSVSSGGLDVSNLLYKVGFDPLICFIAHVRLHNTLFPFLA